MYCNFHALVCFILFMLCVFMCIRIETRVLSACLCLYLCLSVFLSVLFLHVHGKPTVYLFELELPATVLCKDPAVLAVTTCHVCDGFPSIEHFL